MRGRQRRDGGDHRRARRRGRVPRRAHPPGNAAHAAGAWRRTPRHLKSAPGEFREFPDNTADALHSGAMQAICGAVEQMRRQIDTNPAQVRVYLAGGAATEIAAHLEPAGRGRRQSRARGRARAGRRQRRPFNIRRCAPSSSSSLLANLALAGYLWLDSASGGEGRAPEAASAAGQDQAAVAAGGRGAGPGEGRRARRCLPRMGPVRRGRTCPRARGHRFARARQALVSQRRVESTTAYWIFLPPFANKAAADKRAAS